MKKLKYLLSQIGCLKYLDTLPVASLDVDIVFFCGDSDKGIIKDGLYYSQIVDPLIDYCKVSNLSYISISSPFSHISKCKTYSNSHTINWVYLIFRRRVWAILFSRKIRTKMVVGIGIPEELIRICKRYQIKTIELMHGFGLGKNDYVWGGDSQRECQNLKADLYIAYDQQTFETLSESFLHKSKVELARHHFFDREEFSKIKAIDALELKIKNKNFKNKNLNVLVSLQHGYDGSRSVLDNIIKNGLIHETLLNYINANKSINWIIKPHPVQVNGKDWDRIRKQLGLLLVNQDNIMIDEFINDDIIALMNFVDAHITMSSGVVVEAAMLNVPSLGLCPTLQPGGIMQDAFKYEENSNLFVKGLPSHNTINEFILKAADKKNNSLNEKLELVNLEKKSAAFYVSKLLATHS